MQFREDLTIAVIVKRLRRENSLAVSRIERRDVMHAQAIALVRREMGKYLPEVKAALAKIEAKSDLILTYVKDFHEDSSEDRFEKIMQLLESVEETEIAPIARGQYYTLDGSKNNHAKVQLKVESLQTFIKNAVDDQDPPSLSAKLDTVISKLKHSLDSASKTILLIERHQKGLIDRAYEIVTMDNEDFHHVAVGHAFLHDRVDNLQRIVYDKTMKLVEGFQEARDFPIGRPVEGKNQVKPITSIDDIYASGKNIQNRLEIIDCFCNNSLEELTYILASFGQPEHIDEEDIPAAAAAGRPQ